MSKKMFSRERERGKLRFSALLILIGLLLFGCDPTTVTITYNANGGEGEMKPQAVESGVEVKLIANTFTKDGSDFTGWNEAKDGSGKAYADGATVTPTGNLTLYAQWQVKSAPEDPGTEDPGTENPGTEDPGTEDPGTEDPGTEDPEPPVDLENHITNLVLIKAVEDTYRQSSGSEFGWTKTPEGYVDMTNETNKTLVEGVTSLTMDGDMYLDGIEYFTGLQNLTLLNNSLLTELPDLTSLNNLQILSVTSCGLTAISDLPVSLKRLELYTNKLTALDISKLTNLTYLDVSVNELTELDITNNTQLIVLLCFNNRMVELDITNVEAFSQTSSDTPPILACGLQEDAEGVLQALTLIGTQEQKTALASFVPAPDTALEDLTELQKPNVGVAWFVPGEELGITAGTAVFDKTDGLTLPVEGQNLPEGATVSVYLGDIQVDSLHVSINGDRTAVIVAPAALTNDTVGMTVTVTVAAEGYNSKYLSYEGVNTVWMPENVTAALADSEAKIGGESVSVTISQTEGSDDLSGIKISSGTYSVNGNAAETLAINEGGRSFTAPILENADVTGTTVTISLVLSKANTTDTVPVDNLTLKVYPETHVRYDGKFYALAQGFDFTDVSTLSDVKDGENAINSVSEEGYVFSISPTGSEKKSLNFSLIDSENIVLTMIEAKWDRNNCANIFVVGVDGQGRADYGWSPFKGNYSFMLGVAASGADSGQRWNSKNDYVRLSVNPTENTFNKYFVFDNGEDNATLGFNDEVKLTTAAITTQGSIARISSISSNSAWPLTFQHANGDDTTNPVTYTLRAVNFYKEISQQ